MDTETLTTAVGHRFHATGDAEKNTALFTVTPDIPMVDALTSVSCLLSTLEDGIVDAAMGDQPLQDNAAWLTHHTLQSAKAVVDSLISSLESRHKAPPCATPMWKRHNGYVSYFILDEMHIQRAPFGKYGPFPTANAMREALDRLERKFPDLILVSRKASLAADMIGESDLNAEYANTLEKIAALAA